MMTPPPSPGCPAFTNKLRSRCMSPPDPPQLVLPSPPRSPSPSPPQSPPSPLTIASLVAKTQPSYHHSRQRHETHIFHQHHSFHEKALDYLSSLLSRTDDEKVAVTAWIGSSEFRITIAYSSSDTTFESYARDLFKDLLRLSQNPSIFDSICLSLFSNALTSGRLSASLASLHRQDNSSRSVFQHLEDFAYDPHPFLGDVRERRRILIPTNLAPYFLKHEISRGFERSNMRKWMRVFVSPLQILTSTVSTSYEKASACLELFKLVDDECLRRIWRGLLRNVYFKFPPELRDVDFEEILTGLTLIPKALGFLKQGWEKDLELRNSLGKLRVVVLKGCNACPEAQIMSLYDLGVRIKMPFYSTPQYIGKSDRSCKGCRILKTILGYEKGEKLLLEDSGSESESPETPQAPPTVDGLSDGNKVDKLKLKAPLRRKWRAPKTLRRELVQAVDRELREKKVRRKGSRLGARDLTHLCP